MAFPTIQFNIEQPHSVKGGIATDIHLSIMTNTIGKSRLRLSLTASTCTFSDDSQEIVAEIDTTAVDEITEIILPIIIKSTLPQVLFIRLLAEIENADGEIDQSRLMVRLDNRTDTITPQPDPITNPV